MAGFFEAAAGGMRLARWRLFGPMIALQLARGMSVDAALVARHVGASGP